MIGIDYYSGIFKLLRTVHIYKTHYVLVMVIRNIITVYIHTSTQNSMGVFVSAGTHLISAVLKFI